MPRPFPLWAPPPQPTTRRSPGVKAAPTFSPRPQPQNSYPSDGGGSSRLSTLLPIVETSPGRRPHLFRRGPVASGGGPGGGRRSGGGWAPGAGGAPKMAAGGGEGGSGPGAAMGDCAEIKSQFRTREGFYKLLPGDGATRRSGPASAQTPAPPQPPQPPPGPASASGPGAAGPASSPPPAGPGPGPALPAVRLSLVRLGEPDGAGEPPATPAGPGAGGDRVCFNLGRELYFYPGCCRRGSQRVSSLHREALGAERMVVPR